MSLAVRVVDGVGLADKADALAGVGGAPRLSMESKGVTLTMLNGGALVVELLLRRRQLPRCFVSQK